MSNCSSRILLDSGECIDDIRFVPGASDVLAKGPFQFTFLGIVDTSAVPLIQIAGPSQDVWTENEATQTWFADRLCSHLQPSEQSRLGVLVLVQAQPPDDGKALPVTEVLFYAVASAGKGTAQHPDDSFTLKAIPLCSEVPSYLPSPPLSPQKPSEAVDACMLPSLEILRTENIAKERKRKQVAGVFDEATARNRKARKKGGEGVVAAAASTEKTVNVLTGHKRPKMPSKMPSQAKSQGTNQAAQGPTVARSHSRTGSVSGYSHDQQPHRMLSRSPSMSSDIRPPSRIGLVETANKRSSLSRMSSLNETASIADRNKEAISRLVMAGMRLYGLQQRKKTGHSRRTSEINIQAPSNSHDQTPQDEAAKDEEYKLIYHQTYKSTVFAFRRAIATDTLYSNPACLQDTVDRLLAIFCGDLLSPIG